ncbi:MAG TPA: SEC-C metal-binding domain-containing protein [Bryobacteraceae bacterium]|nr:SEC-C metal-binding domain-containing protein [Bryobacteraceae bacterium]
MPDLTEDATTATGPRTPEGKARSSQNATKIGLYTARDFILKGEEDEYIEGFNDLMRELDPQTPLEKLFATEIMSANWRLRRCRVIEADLALQPETDEKTQRSVDRARTQSHVIVRRSMSELRKLQTERVIRAHAALPGIAGLADTARVLAVVDRVSDDIGVTASPSAGKRIGLDDLEALMTQADKRLCEQIRSEGASSFCKTAAPAPVQAPIRSSKTPRNSPCPCRSGLKYKKCCGSPAREALKPAA